MIIASLAAVALVVSAAVAPIEESNGAVIQMSVQQRNVAIQPLVRSATECIARSVVADPRFDAHGDDSQLGDLIVTSMHACVGPVRAMIDAYDRYFGDGSGEAFFMGPYLDILPRAVDKWVTNSTE
jgi:hypothetical protein